MLELQTQCSLLGGSMRCAGEPFTLCNPSGVRPGGGVGDMSQRLFCKPPSNRRSVVGVALAVTKGESRVPGTGLPGNLLQCEVWWALARQDYRGLLSEEAARKDGALLCATIHRSV